MTPQELADILSRMYRDAQDGEKSITALRFGIRYAGEISRCGESVKEIVRLSRGVSDGYHRDCRKGVRLARYVCLRPEIAHE